MRSARRTEEDDGERGTEAEREERGGAAPEPRLLQPDRLERRLPGVSLGALRLELLALVGVLLRPL